MDDFVKDHQLQLRLVKILGRTDRAGFDEAWSKTATHYQFKIEAIGFGPVTEFFGTYSQGSAHKTAPRLSDILDSLAMDCSGLDKSFESWCDDFGYDTDSRKAFSVYEECLDIRKRLIALLGRNAFRELIEDVERL